jgi:hypothetical protein
MFSLLVKGASYIHNVKLHFMGRGFDLPASWIIHAVGPKYKGRTRKEERESEQDLTLAYQ